MTREPLYRRMADPDDASLGRPPRSVLFPWATVGPLALLLVIGLARAGFALGQGGRWGGEPSVALLVAVVAARMLLDDVRAWRRARSRTHGC